MLEKYHRHGISLHRICQGLLLSVTLLAPLLIMRHKSVTFDEVTHLPSGYSYWKRRSIQYNQQHPPLVKEICALPLVLMGVQGPAEYPENEWTYGQSFLFRPSADASRLVFWGRVPAVLLSVGLAGLVMLWSQKLWGKAAGLLSLCLYAFDPTLTAHSQLITTDVGVGFFSTLYLFSLRTYLARPSRKRLAVTGLLLGLALGSKFSAVVLIPVSAALMLIAARSRKSDWPASDWENGKAGTASARSAEIRIPLTPTRLCSRLLPSIFILTLASTIVWVLYFCPRDPLFYWRGIQSVNQDHPSAAYYYLMGSLKPEGWKLYLLVAWLVKTPLPSLLLLAVATGLFWSGQRKGSLDEAFLILPALSFFAFYSALGDNIGVRYLIPCFPFFFIFTGRLASRLQAARQVYKLALASLLIWHISEYVAITPDHLSYFNQIAGGAEQGIDWLDNSNVDWGQGLFQLRDFLETSRIEDFAFFYFGTGEPEYYGVRGRRIEDFSFVVRPTYGVVILSAHGIPRARDVLYRAFGSGPLNWLLHTKPRAIVGHAYFVYEIQ